MSADADGGAKSMHSIDVRPSAFTSSLLLSTLGFGITLCDARNEKNLEVLLTAVDTSIGQVVVERKQWSSSSAA